jgi:hypothetical protein
MNVLAETVNPDCLLATRFFPATFERCSLKSSKTKDRKTQSCRLAVFVAIIALLNAGDARADGLRNVTSLLSKVPSVAEFDGRKLNTTSMQHLVQVQKKVLATRNAMDTVARAWAALSVSSRNSAAGRRLISALIARQKYTKALLAAYRSRLAYHKQQPQRTGASAKSSSRSSSRNGAAISRGGQHGKTEDPICEKFKKRMRGKEHSLTKTSLANSAVFRIFNKRYPAAKRPVWMYDGNKTVNRSKKRKEFEFFIADLRKFTKGVSDALAICNEAEFKTVGRTRCLLRKAPAKVMSFHLHRAPGIKCGLARSLKTEKLAAFYGKALAKVAKPQKFRSHEPRYLSQITWPTSHDEKFRNLINGIYKAMGVPLSPTTAATLVGLAKASYNKKYMRILAEAKTMKLPKRGPAIPANGPRLGVKRLKKLYPKARVIRSAMYPGGWNRKVSSSTRERVGRALIKETTRFGKVNQGWVIFRLPGEKLCRWFTFRVWKGKLESLTSQLGT